MQDFRSVLTLTLSILIVIFILLQGKGAGLGSAWGGSGEAFQTRRGIEVWVLRTTAVLVALFLLLSVLNLLV